VASRRLKAEDAIAAIRQWLGTLDRRRVTTLIIVLIIEALIIFAVITANMSSPPRRTVQNDLVAINLSLPKAVAEKKPVSTNGASARPKERPAAPVPVVKVPRPSSPFVIISREDFAASDISKLGKSTGSGASSGAKSAYGPGEGPGGKTLYPAEWYVEPSRTALAAYLPNGAPEGSWAMIACRTIENYQVDNCYGLGQSQQGLSSALRQAAWQFRVRPPRVDGKPLVGAWVRIRFDFNKDGRD